MRRASVIAGALCACSPAQPSLRGEARETAPQLVLHCAPGDAEVVVDGVPFARCADLSEKPIALKKGLRHVEVRKSGHQRYETWLDPDGTQAALQVTLQPNAGIHEAGGTP